MRIIGGKIKGRKLSSVKHQRIRPTSERVRESIFDILSFFVKGANVLDLFSGTGALGIEALSRGAKRVVFIEKSSKATKLLKENVNKLGLKEVTMILPLEIEKGLKNLSKKGEIFDIIFMDPPYDKGLIKPTLYKIIDFGILKKEGVIVVEHTARERPSPIFGLEIIKEKHYGDTFITLLHLRE